MFFIPTSMPPPSMHQTLTELGRCCMQNNRLLTKSHVELNNNSILEQDPKESSQVYPLQAMNISNDLPVEHIDLLKSGSDKRSPLPVERPCKLCTIALIAPYPLLSPTRICTCFLQHFTRVSFSDTYE
jgi:hypothetical protein